MYQSFKYHCVAKIQMKNITQVTCTETEVTIIYGWKAQLDSLKTPEKLTTQCIMALISYIFYRLKVNES